MIAIIIRYLSSILKPLYFANLTKIIILKYIGYKGQIIWDKSKPDGTLLID